MFSSPSSSRALSSLLVPLFAILAASACTDEPAGEDEGAIACVGGQFCPEGLDCINGICVDPSGADTTSDDEAGTTGTGEGGTAESAEGSTGSSTGGSEGSSSSAEDATFDEGDPPPDMGGGGEDCDVFAQDCPPGQECAPYAAGGDEFNANKCVPVVGTDQLGQSCQHYGTANGEDSCAEGLMCLTTTAGTDGICTAYCTGTLQNPQCGGGDLCLVTNADSMALCMADCHPLQQNCGAEDVCYATTGGTICAAEGEIPPGGACSYINDCSPGSMCANGQYLSDCADRSCCSQWCNTEGSDCPAANPTCTPYFPSVVALQFAMVGVCTQ